MHRLSRRRERYGWLERVGLQPIHPSPATLGWTLPATIAIRDVDLAPRRGDFRSDKDQCTMKDVLPEVDAWRTAGNQVAIATVVKVEGSAPRPVGATLAVSSAGDLAGSVSGGCVETAVFEEAQEVLRTGQPKLIRYGITDEMAWDVGLACGGTIEVFVEPVTE